MESVGQKLRAARLECGLSLEDLSARTRINVKSLAAVEADEFEKISSRFLYKSFVRQMASLVGLAPEGWGAELDAALGQFREPLVPGQAGAPIPPNLPSLRSSRVRPFRWIASLGLLIGMLAACSTLYSMWQKSRGASLRASLPAGTRPAKSAVAADTAPVRVEVDALERTWLSVAADGKDVYTGILQASERKTLESRQVARVRTGDAAAVEIIFNGKNLGALGSRGQAETVEFQKNGYHVIEPANPRLALADLRVAGSSEFRR